MAPPESPSIDANGPFLQALVRRLVPEHQVDDVVQDTWLAALRRPPRRSWSAWLTRVARNRAYESHRAATRRARREEHVARREGTPATDEWVARHETARRVADAVFGLPEPARTTLLLRFYDGLPPREIAKRLDVPVATVRTRLRRTLDRLRDELDDGTSRADGQGRLLSLFTVIAAPPRWLIGATLMTVKTKVAVGAAVAVVALSVGAYQLTRPPEPVDGGGGAPASPSTVGDAPDDGTGSPVPGSATPVGVRTSPFRETSRSAPSRSTRVVEVFRGDGAPAVDARVIVFEDDDILGRAQTDTRGRANLPVTDDAVELAVGWTGAPIHKAPYPGGADVLTVRLPKGRKLTGTVIPDRTPPSQGLRVVLHLDAGTREIGRNLPDPVRDALGHRGDGVVIARVSPGGAFAFGGLGDDWRGEIGVDRHEIRRPPSEVQDERLPLAAPEHHLVLQLVTRPVIKGRVVTADGSAAVAGGRVKFRTGETQGYFGSTSADREGRYHIDVPPGTRRAWIEVALPDGNAAHEVEVACDVEVVTDMGDVPVKRIDPRRLVVTGWHGRPVKGARAEVGERWSVPTNDDGVASIDVPDGARSLRVHAPGYQDADVPLPRDPREEIRCVLRPSNRLRVKVRTPSGKPPLGVRVEVRSKAPLFRERPPPPGSRPGFSTPFDDVRRRMRRGRGTRRPVSLDAAGDGEITDVRPMVPFSITVVDRLGAPIAAKQQLTLAADERRDLEIELPTEPRSFTVLVNQASGPALDAVDVMVKRGGRYVGAETDETGRVRFDGVYEEMVDLIIERRGWVPIHRAGYRLPPRGRAARFAMTRGASLEVKVKDAAGRPANVGFVRVEDPALLKPLDAERTARGVYRLEGLAAGDVLIHVSHDGRDLRRRVAASAGEVEVRLAELKAPR